MGLKIGYPNSNIKDESYGGVGIQFENDFSNIVLEYGSDYTKGSAVLKYDIANDFYIKGGLGILEREMQILGSDKDVTQTTLGAGLGYGDEKSFNIEVGYADSKLKNAASADGHSKVSYVEAVGKHSFGEYLTFDVVGIAKNTNVFDKNHDDYQVELGWFPTNDARVFSGYDSSDSDNDDYAVRAGIQYTFATGKISPYLKATANTDENVNIGVEYSEGIANKSLKMRDFFEYTIGTSNIVAQVVAPEVFAKKVAVQVEAPQEEKAENSAPTASDVTISMTANGAFFDVHIDLTDYIADDKDTDSKLTVIVVASPTQGDVIFGVGPFVRYTKNGENSSNTDTFTYKIKDTDGLFSDVKTVTVTDIPIY